MSDDHPLDYPLKKMDAGIRTRLGNGISRISTGQNGGGMKVAVLSDGYGWLRFYSEDTHDRAFSRIVTPDSVKFVATGQLLVQRSRIQPTNSDATVRPACRQAYTPLVANDK